MDVLMRLLETILDELANSKKSLVGDCRSMCLSLTISSSLTVLKKLLKAASAKHFAVSEPRMSLIVD